MEVVVVEFQAIYHNVSGVSDEDRHHFSRWSVSVPKFEPAATEYKFEVLPLQPRFWGYFTAFVVTSKQILDKALKQAMEAVLFANCYSQIQTYMRDAVSKNPQAGLVLSLQ